MRQVSQRAQAVRPSATLQASQRAKDLQAQGVDVINLGIGQPDFPTPANIKRATVTAINENQVDGYTATNGVLPLRQAVADRMASEQGVHVTADQVVVTTGAKLALYALFQVLIDPGDEVLLPAPYWVSYAEQVKLAGGVPVEVAPTTSLKVTPAQLEAAVTDRTTAIVLNSPQNPSGVVYTPAELQAIGDWAVRHDLWIVADEIYGELIYDRDAPVPSMLTLSQPVVDHTIVINGVSKTYAMTGWRIGWAIGPTDLMATLTRLLSHVTGNTAAVSQAAATAALTESQATVTSMKASFKDRLDTLYPLVTAIPGFDLPHKPSGAFYLFPDVQAAMALKHCATTDEFVGQVLDQAHVAVVTGEAFGLPHHLRISYATDKATLIEAMARLTAFMTD